MTFRTKKRIVQGTLLVLLVWPLLHIIVVRSTGISPWRGFGWGMYTVPVLPVQVGVSPLEGTTEQAKQGQEEMVQAIKMYLKRYQALGGLAKPDAVAHSVFEAYPGLKLIEINVTQHKLDHSTARVVEDRADKFRYRRGAGLQKEK
jgi:hypothetical protein